MSQKTTHFGSEYVLRVSYKSDIAIFGWRFTWTNSDSPFTLTVPLLWQSLIRNIFSFPFSPDFWFEHYKWIDVITWIGEGNFSILQSSFNQEHFINTSRSRSAVLLVQWISVNLERLERLITRGQNGQNSIILLRVKLFSGERTDLLPQTQIL